MLVSEKQNGANAQRPCRKLSHMIPSLRDVLLQQAVALRTGLRELMAQSRVERRFEQSGGFLVVVTGKPFRWTPLAPSARPLQGRLRAQYLEFAGLVDALVADQRAAVREDVVAGHGAFLGVVDQDGPLTHESVDENERSALSALDDALRIVAELGAGDPNEAILVPDTNALYARPALEEWSFPECSRFALALVAAVVRELDRHKDHHPIPDVREKARKLVRQISEYRRRGSLVDGVTIRNGRSRLFSWAREPRMDTLLSWLDPLSADDRLIASAIDIARNRALAPVAIVTRDLNLQNKCELARVPFLWPPGDVAS
jgi:hypothetical protein